MNIEEDFFKKLNKKVTEIQRDLFYELVNEKIKDEIVAILIGRRPSGLMSTSVNYNSLGYCQCVGPDDSLL